MLHLPSCKHLWIPSTQYDWSCPWTKTFSALVLGVASFPHRATSKQVDHGSKMLVPNLEHKFVFPSINLFGGQLYWRQSKTFPQWHGLYMPSVTPQKLNYLHHQCPWKEEELKRIRVINILKHVCTYAFIYSTLKSCKNNLWICK